IGKAPVAIPAGVTFGAKDNVVTVKGPKGELTQDVNPLITIKEEDGVINLVRTNEDKQTKSLHGLYRSLIHNMVVGVHEGYVIKQELVGVGYRAKVTGQQIELSAGFPHPIVLQVPEEIKVNSETAKGHNPIITLESHDKQLIGQLAAKLRSMRKPVHYQGKGIHFVREQVKRKAGKAAGK